MKLHKGFGVVGGFLLSALSVLSTPVYAQLFTSDPSVTNVSGTAFFSLGTGTVTVTLTNTQPNIHDTAQTLSDISFSVSGGQAVGSNTPITSETTSLVSFADNQAPTGSTGTATWFLSGNGNYTLTALVGNNKSLIVGPISNPATYCQTGGQNNKCPDGMGTFNPYVGSASANTAGSATFTLAIAGVTPDSTISNVIFSFGTGPETFVGVPIPAAVWLFISGLIGLIGIARRKISGPAPALAAA